MVRFHDNSSPQPAGDSAFNPALAAAFHAMLSWRKRRHGPGEDPSAAGLRLENSTGQK